MPMDNCSEVLVRPASIRLRWVFSSIGFMRTFACGRDPSASASTSRSSFLPSSVCGRRTIMPETGGRLIACETDALTAALAAAGGCG